MEHLETVFCFYPLGVRTRFSTSRVQTGPTAHATSYPVCPVAPFPGGNLTTVWYQLVLSANIVVCYAWIGLLFCIPKILDSTPDLNIGNREICFDLPQVLNGKLSVTLPGSRSRAATWTTQHRRSLRMRMSTNIKLPT